MPKLKPLVLMVVLLAPQIAFACLNAMRDARAENAQENARQEQLFAEAMERQQEKQRLLMRALGAGTGLTLVVVGGVLVAQRRRDQRWRDAS